MPPKSDIFNDKDESMVSLKDVPDKDVEWMETFLQFTLLKEPSFIFDSAVPHITLVKGNIEESTFLHLYILHFRLCKKRPFKQARNELATGKEREGEITGREIAIYESAVQERR